jgi:Domain of unknown function (DUF4397)/Secretion system C-terminal sorting domain
MKKVVLMAGLFLIGIIAFAQTARVQVVHNSADLAAATVDVYVDDVNTLDNFEFRTASAFVDLPAGVEIELSIAPGNSTSVGDALLTVPVTLVDGETYVVVAYGIVSPTGYNPAPPLSLEVFAGAREVAMSPTNVDILVHHGATDAPTVDVVETGVGAGTIVDDISTSEFQGYVSVPEADYNLEVRLEDGTTQVAAYNAPLATLGLEGAAVTVYASGFLDPSENSNGPAFGLYAVTAAGGPMIALPEGVLSVNEFEKNNFAIFPNPTKNYIQVTGDWSQNLAYTVVDTNGRVVLKGDLSSDKTIDTDTLAQGLYILNLFQNNSVVNSSKFIKE